MENAIPTKADLTRERILEAAEAVFARHGLNGTRVRAVADAAGVNVATLYIYFPGKRELYEAVLELGIRPLIDLMTEFSAGPGRVEATAALLRAGMKHLRGRPNLSRLIYLEAISEGSYLTELARRWFRPLLERGVAQIEAARPSIPWGENLARLIVPAFVQLSFGHFALAPLFREVFDGDPTSDEWVEEQTRFMVTLAQQIFPEQVAPTE